MANRTILIVDDDPERLAYYFNLLEVDDISALDILGGQPAPKRWHPTLRQQDPLKFDGMFEGMVRDEFFYPLCIIDMRMPESPGGPINERRGLQTARRVRELDPDIHIMVCTADPDIEAGEILGEVGGSTHFFRLPFDDAQEREFCGKVRELVDEWNERH